MQGYLRALVLLCPLLATGVIVSATSRAASDAPGSGAWGEILLVGAESDPRYPSHCIAELYDPLRNRFTDNPPRLHIGRAGASITSLEVGQDAGSALVAAGYMGRVGPIGSTELFDPAQRTFLIGPHLIGGVLSPTANVLPSGPMKGFVMFLEDGIQFYDPLRRSVIDGPKTPHSLLDHTATLLQSGPDAGKFLIAGGFEPVPMPAADRDPSHPKYAPTPFSALYDPRKNESSLGPKMNAARENFTATLLSSGPRAGDLLLIGGWTAKTFWDRATALASTEVYVSATNRFAPPQDTPKLIAARTFHTATLIRSGLNAGKLLIAGGQSDRTNLLASTEFYDPANNRFTPGPPLHRARSQHVAMLLENGPNAGKILIAGGVGYKCDRDGCRHVGISSTELYDPATNSFAPGPPMYGSPGQVTAFQLPMRPPDGNRTRPRKPFRSMFGSEGCADFDAGWDAPLR